MKILVECSNPNDLESLEAAAEQMAGRCNVTYYKQHQAMVEAGVSSSQRESARKIAEETGDSPAAVEQRIRRGKGVRQVVADTPSMPLKESIRAEDDKDKASESFLNCYHSMEREIINSKKLGWKQTDRKTALKYISRLLSIAETQGRCSRQREERNLISEIRWRFNNLRESLDRGERFKDDAATEMEALSIPFREHVKRLCEDTNYINGGPVRPIGDVMIRCLISTMDVLFRRVDSGIFNDRKPAEIAETTP